jgi:uncharacterized membrane protein
LPAVGAGLGILLALAVRNVGRSPDPASWAITVERARDTLMGALAIVFTGLSIVLALTAVTAQNVAGRFSLRLLRIQQRGLRDPPRGRSRTKGSAAGPPRPAAHSARNRKRPSP